MDILKIAKEFEKHNIDTFVYGNDFMEFKGIVILSSNVKFDVEGTVEWFANEQELSYSISVLNIEENEEVLNDCGSYTGITENEIAEKVKEIICCDFEKL